MKLTGSASSLGGSDSALGLYAPPTSRTGQETPQHFASTILVATTTTTVTASGLHTSAHDHTASGNGELASSQSSTTTTVAAIAATTTTTGTGDGGSGSSSSSSSSDGPSRTTVIVLSTVLSTVGLIMIAGGIWACLRYRRRRSRLFSRGITPIGDDEIETWKGRNRGEKSLEDGGGGGMPRHVVGGGPDGGNGGSRGTGGGGGHQKHESTSSTKKPPSVIVYARKSEEQWTRSPTTPGTYHPGKTSWDGGPGSGGGPKTSLDKELPFTPIQARAPNAREGLTDETVPGDDPFIQSPKRRSSRLYKPLRTPQQAHTRRKSSRSSSSLYRFGGGGGGGRDGGGGGDGGAAVVSDSDEYRTSHEYYRPGHVRGYSSVSSPPPRLSLSEDWPDGNGGARSPQPLVRPEEIGRAIG